MNNPFATQSESEARIAARLTDPEALRRTLRLDNPNMLGVYTGNIPNVHEYELIPTPRCGG